MRYRIPAPSCAGDVPGQRGNPELLPGSPESCEMPIVRSPWQGKPTRFIYSVDQFCDRERRPWAALMKSDVETGTMTEWRAPPRCFVGEPCFVPRGAAEDDGVLIVLQFDAGRQRSALLLMDA